MLLNCINSLTGGCVKQNALDKSVAPSGKFGPDEAVLELIEDEIGMITEETFSINYDAIKLSAIEKGVEEKEVDNTISFLTTLNPIIARRYRRDDGLYIMVWVANFVAFREKYPNIPLTDQDTAVSNDGSAIVKKGT